MRPSNSLIGHKRQNKPRNTRCGFGFKLITAPISVPRIRDAYSLALFHRCSCSCNSGGARRANSPCFASHAHAFAVALTHSFRSHAHTVSDAYTHSNPNAIISTYSQAEAVSFAQPHTVAQPD